ncbi:MAG: hypothetical protein RLZZ89_789, partial [Cyanobacteriota bacterium]
MGAGSAVKVVEQMGSALKTLVNTLQHQIA